MTFSKLIYLLNRFTFENIIKIYNELYNTNYKLQCRENEVIYDNELESFLYSMGSEIIECDDGISSIKTIEHNIYEIPYKNINKNEIALIFNRNKIYNQTEELSHKII